MNILKHGTEPKHNAGQPSRTVEGLSHRNQVEFGIVADARVHAVRAASYAQTALEASNPGTANRAAKLYHLGGELGETEVGSSRPAIPIDPTVVAPPAEIGSPQPPQSQSQPEANNWATSDGGDLMAVDELAHARFEGNTVNPLIAPLAQQAASGWSGDGRIGHQSIGQVPDRAPAEADAVALNHYIDELSQVTEPPVQSVLPHNVLTLESARAGVDQALPPHVPRNLDLAA